MFEHFDVRKRLAGCVGYTFTDKWCIEYIVCAVLDGCGYSYRYEYSPGRFGSGHYVALRAYTASRVYAFTVHIGARKEGAGYRGYIDSVI